VTQEANLSSDEAQDISFGMYYSVECGEDMDFLKGQDIMAAASAVNIELYKYTYDSLMREFTECQLWPQIPVPAVQKQPVVSSIPTLLLSGEYDPITPPDNGIMAARTLSNGYFLQFPATGHGVLGTNKCADMIVTAFLDNPNQHPNAQCITTMQEPKFE
jgi:pimeloyl-ACP methyl ester carboxylesterase